MGIADKHIDRLLPRHESATNLDLAWNVRTERSGLFRKHSEELSDPASIRDISLEGALVEVANTHVHETDERIAVRFRGLDGYAVIRHCRPGEDDTLLYGVNFLPDPTFNNVVHAAVGDLRGHATELTDAWKRTN